MTKSENSGNRYENQFKTDAGYISAYNKPRQDFAEKNRKFDITNYGDRLNREAKNIAKKADARAAKKAAKNKLGDKLGDKLGAFAKLGLGSGVGTGLGLGSGLGPGSKFCSIILKILRFLERCVTNGIVQMKQLEMYLLKFSVVLYLPKGLLLILILLIVLSELLSPLVPELGFLNDKQVLHHVYSICKFMNILLILIATLMGAAKVTDKLSSETSRTFPFPLLLSGYIIASMPLLYELLSLLALSSIVLAYYSVKCDGKIPNTWGFVENISGLLLTLGGIGFILALLQFKMKKTCSGGEGTDKLRSPTILMLTSISYFLILIVASGFEKVVSKNVGYWIGLLENGGNPTEDCYSGAEETENEGFTKVLNMILSIVITILLLVIVIVGCIPLPSLMSVNNNIKMALFNLEGKIFGLLMS